MALLDLFKRKARAVPAAAPARVLAPAPAVPISLESEEDVLTYPPARKGIPALPVDTILERQADLIKRLEYGMGCTPEVFNGLVRPVIWRFAAFVHLLPASEMHHHRGPGGLLQHSLEVAWLASQSSARHVFCHDRPPSDKYHIEPRWRVAARIAGLLHDLGKPVGALAVGERDGKLVWAPYREPLADWLVRRRMAKYYLHWRDTHRHNQHELMAGQVVNLVLTEALLDYFQCDAEIHPAVLGVITGTSKKTSLLASLVSQADQASVAKDLKEHRYDPNALSLGVPVDRYLVDAMRRLAKRGVWTCNTNGSRLWMLHDGLHVVWPQGGEEIIAELDDDNIPGIPKMHETIADILVDRGHVVSWEEGGRTRFYRKITPAPLGRDGKGITLTTLLLSTPDLVYPGHPPEPVGIWEDGRVVPAQPRRAFDAEVEQAPALARGEQAGVVETRVATASPSIPDSDGEDTQQPALSASHADPKQAAAPINASHATDATSMASETDTKQAMPSSQDLLVSASDPEPDVPPSVVQDQRPQPITPSVSAPARAWLGKQGAAGNVLLALAEFIGRGDRPRGHAVLREDQLLLPYPEALADLAVDGLAPDPNVLRQALSAGNLIEVDMLHPFLKSQEIDGRSWVVLTLEAGTAINAVLLDVAGGAQTQAIEPAPACEHP